MSLAADIVVMKAADRLDSPEVMGAQRIWDEQQQKLLTHDVDDLLGLPESEIQRLLRLHTPEMERENYLLFFMNKFHAKSYDMHLEWHNLLASSPRLCLLAPRDSGKTHFFVVGYVLWNIVYNRHKLIYLISDSADQAMDLLQKIKDEIETNPAFRYLKDKDKPEMWSRQAISCTNGVRIKVKGFGTAIRGPHPGLIILDDVLNDQDPLTAAGRNKAEKYFKSAVSNMIRKNKKSQIVLVGTAQHFKDLLHILEDNPAYTWRKYKAIVDKKTKKVLIPERYNWADLQAKKIEIGSLAFAKEFQNEPLDEDSTLFPWELMKLAYDQSFEAPYAYDGNGPFDCYLGADFSTPGASSSGSSGGGDWTVILTIGVHRETERVFLFDVFRGRGLAFTEQLDVVIERMRRFSCVRGFLEDNVFQRIYSQVVQSNTSLPVYGHTVNGGNKKSLSSGVPSMVVMFENLKMVLPYAAGDERGKLMTDGLCEELHSFRMMDGKLGTVADHDDMVMALWHSFSAWRDGGRYGSAASKGHVDILRKGPAIRRSNLSDLEARGYGST